MTVVVVFHGHIFIPASSENAFIGDNIQCFMLCLLANSTLVRWLSYVVLAAALDIIYTKAAVIIATCSNHF